MLKLYKTGPFGVLYWETWPDGPKHIIHWGIVGQRGQRVETTDAENLQRSITERRAEGYSERTTLSQLVIQYATNGSRNVQDLRRRQRLESLLDETLGWTGLGYCDGGDIGSGTINIFCFVVDPAAAVECIVQALRRRRALKGAVIAEERDGAFVVRHPPGHAGQFRLV